MNYNNIKFKEYHKLSLHLLRIVTPDLYSPRITNYQENLRSQKSKYVQSKYCSKRRLIINLYLYLFFLIATFRCPSYKIDSSSESFACCGAWFFSSLHFLVGFVRCGILVLFLFCAPMGRPLRLISNLHNVSSKL